MNVREAGGVDTCSESGRVDVLYIPELNEALSFREGESEFHCK